MNTTKIEHVKTFGRTLTVAANKNETLEDAITRKLERDGFKKIHFPSAGKRAAENWDVPASGRVFATGKDGEVAMDYKSAPAAKPGTKTLEDAAAAAAEMAGHFTPEELDLPLCELPDHHFTEVSHLNGWSHDINDCDIRIAIGQGNQWSTTLRDYLRGLAETQFTYDGTLYPNFTALKAASGEQA